MGALTRDNLHLSRPTNIAAEGAKFAVGCKYDTEGSAEIAVGCKYGVGAAVEQYVRDSVSENTRRAYHNDLADFEAWGGSVPASDEVVAAYLADRAECLAVATLVRRLAAISKAHEAKVVENPARAPLVKATLRGIKRSRGIAQRQAKPLLREDLFAILSAIGSAERAKDARDRALLLIGFAGGFRRSELVGFDFGDIERVRQGVVLHLRRSKTDQFGEGRRIGVPFGRGKWCPVLALDQWTDASQSSAGPLFRRVDRHGRVLAERLSGEAVSIILRERAMEAGLVADAYSGHSLRAGFATSAAQAGVSSWKIRQQTGHASDAMLARYIRSGELFEDHPVHSLL